jgi:hypothetical protein
MIAVADFDRNRNRNRNRFQFNALAFQDTFFFNLVKIISQCFMIPCR